MLIAVLSDVHANLPALEAVLADARQERPDAYVVAGDLTIGPHQSEVLAILQSLNGWLIRGNTDTNLLRLVQGVAPSEWRSFKQFALMRWSEQHVTPDELRFLTSLPEECNITLPGLAPIRLVHGSPGHPAQGVHPSREQDEVKQALTAIVEDVLVCGHTHEQWQAEMDGRLVLNPGAVCGPLDGTVGAQYALLHWQGGRWQAELRMVPYEISRISAAFVDTGLLEEGGPLANAFLLSIETGKDVTLEFLRYAQRIARDMGFGEVKWIPDAAWDIAAETFHGLWVEG
jgi:putative phosphoesterase